MLEPKRQKYRKAFRGKRRGVATRGVTLSFGEFGLKSLGRGWLASRQIEAARKAITHALKKGGRVWIRVFPDKPVTSRPAGKRMGSGKGEIDRYVAVVIPGRILFEIAGTTKEIAKTAFERASNKLPFNTKFISKE
ncbi:50S ribosomal protein L16 [Candidatus Woesebacteria bacterium RIFCSPLOWO2_01_FULL_43_11]|nr:MAG: 50S ribosomal protein L16 [Candidatus Woesebacteria bacterium RIFCSPLOWO2_01_FULL_43_11]